MPWIAPGIVIRSGHCQSNKFDLQRDAKRRCHWTTRRCAALLRILCLVDRTTQTIRGLYNFGLFCFFIASPRPKTLSLETDLIVPNRPLQTQSRNLIHKLSVVTMSNRFGSSEKVYGKSLQAWDAGARLLWPTVMKLHSNHNLAAFGNADCHSSHELRRTSDKSRQSQHKGWWARSGRQTRCRSAAWRNIKTSLHLRISDITQRDCQSSLENDTCLFFQDDLGSLIFAVPFLFMFTLFSFLQSLHSVFQF